jgi:hypothetical protein
MRRLLIAALLFVPSLALAQRGGASSQAAKHTEMDPQTASGPTLRTRDIEDMSPIKLLIDKRKDLKLTDAQLSGLKDAEPKLKEANAPLLKQVDSLMRRADRRRAKPLDHVRREAHGRRCARELRRRGEGRSGEARPGAADKGERAARQAA